MKKEDFAFLKGIYAAALTPIREDFSCQDEVLAYHCLELVKKGCQGVVVFGTTGEGTSFSIQEKQRTLKKIIELGVNPAQLIVCINCCALTDAISLAQTALELNCLKLLVAPPFFYKRLTEEGIIEFYQTFIKCVIQPHLQLLLYHIPQLNQTPLSLTIIQKLLDEFPSIVKGIKESEGNLIFIKEILKYFPNFQVFVGDERLIHTTMQIGGSGGISGLANIFPELIHRLYHSSENMINEINQMTNIIEIIHQYPLFPAIKKLLEFQKGADWHFLRPPLKSLDLQQTQALQEALGNLFSY